METHHLRDVQLGHGLLRLLIGANFFIHGLVRLPKLSTFAAGMAQSFEGTLLPTGFAHGVGFIIPGVELILGILLILGLFTREALVASGLVMVGLTVGIGIEEKWPVAAQQLGYGLVIFVLLALLRCNRWSLDARLGRVRSK